MSELRILHLAPLWFPIGKDSPGGIETFMAGLLESLEARGCANTLIATGDSTAAGELVPVTPENLVAQMEAERASEYAYYEQRQLRLALEMAPVFDVVDSHIGAAAYCLSAVPEFGDRVIHTHHNPIYSDLEWFARQHPDTRFSTVSEFQARKLRRQGVRRCHVIHNGVSFLSFPFAPERGETLLFLGRMEWEKGPDIAIDVARRLGRSLTLAGPIVEERYFDERIGPSLDGQLRYVGSVGDEAKKALLRRSGCVLVPSRCEEGFGMVCVEAMACGTPVVALANGALPEIVDPGVTGYVAPDEERLPDLVERALLLDRRAVRERARLRFDVARIAAQYHALYRDIVRESGPDDAVRGASSLARRDA